MNDCVKLAKEIAKEEVKKINDREREKKVQVEAAKEEYCNDIRGYPTKTPTNSFCRSIILLLQHLEDQLDCRLRSVNQFSFV